MNQIYCDYCDAMLHETYQSSQEAATYIYPPLLPFLLASCAPGVELSLTMESFEGKQAISSDL